MKKQLQQRLPTDKEQEEVMRYVLERPLERPDTSYAKVAVCIFAFCAAVVLLAAAAYYVFRIPAVSDFLPQSFNEFISDHKAAFIMIAVCFWLIAGAAVMAKKAVIGAVRLYQRYAPEEVRRKCLFKPTCSEYTILAVKKYGVIKGLYKAWDRLFRRCKGHIFMIDEP